MQLHDLDETEWRLIQKMIPKASSVKEPRLGAIRASVNGILWRMRTGQPWSHIPREYGDYTSICRRFTEWRQTGVWQQVTTMLAHARAVDVGLEKRLVPYVSTLRSL
jgi:transposase